MNVNNRKSCWCEFVICFVLVYYIGFMLLIEIFLKFRLRILFILVVRKVMFGFLVVLVNI